MSNNWISIHTFYFGNLNYLIVDCIAPLVTNLREQGLIRRYFFIKYWMEGPHVRLRLLPAEGADEEKIKYQAGAAIKAFLKRRPALYSLDSQKFAGLYKKMFILEYGEEKWRESYGDEGAMSLRPNNTFEYIKYEPEYSRYGGIAGVELAEWHFEYSSDTVIDLLRKTNIDVQSMLLGRSIQLALPFFYGVFKEDNGVVLAVNKYMAYWLRANPQGNKSLLSYAPKYQHMAPMLQQRVAKIRRYMLEEQQSERLTEVEKNWKQHVNEFRLRVEKLYSEQKIVLDLPYQQSAPTLEDVCLYLQSSYVHMTNNRLGVSLTQELYVAYLLKRSLEELLDKQVQEV